MTKNHQKCKHDFWKLTKWILIYIILWLFIHNMLHLWFTFLEANYCSLMSWMNPPKMISKHLAKLSILMLYQLNVIWWHVGLVFHPFPPTQQLTIAWIFCHWKMKKEKFTPIPQIIQFHVTGFHLCTNHNQTCPVLLLPE